MRAIIFVNGTVADYATLDRSLQPDDYLIAADGGVHHCLAIGRTPHALIGDLDSVDPATVEKLAEQDVFVERHPAAKNATDLELALDHALALHNHSIPFPPSYAPSTPTTVAAIILVGAMGGRVDQMLGNVLILAQRDWPLPVMLLDGHVQAQVVRPGLPVTLTATTGDTVSALPLSDTVTGITYSGMDYPLVDHTLQLGSTRGMSNKVASTPATVQIDSGRLLLVEELKPDPV